MDGSRGTIFFLPFRDTSSSTSCMKLAISGGSRWISLSLSPSFRNLTSWKNCWKTKQVHVGLTDICNANFLPNMECKTVSSLVFPGGSVVKNLPAIAGDMSLIPGSRWSSGRRNGNPPHILAWRLPWTEEPGGPKSIHMVTKSQTRLSNKQTQHPSSAKQLRKTCIIKLTCLCFFKKKKKERKQYSGEQWCVYHPLSIH